MIDFAADVTAIFSDVMAVDATYTPDGGSPVAVRVVPSMPDDGVEFGITSIRVNTIVLQLPVSQVATPATGDVIVIDGATYTVAGEPRRDPRRLIWTIEARLQSS